MRDIQNELCNILSKYGVSDIYNAETEITQLFLPTVLPTGDMEKALSAFEKLMQPLGVLNQIASYADFGMWAVDNRDVIRAAFSTPPAVDKSVVEALLTAREALAGVPNVLSAKQKLDKALALLGGNTGEK